MANASDVAATHDDALAMFLCKAAARMAPFMRAHRHAAEPHRPAKAANSRVCAAAQAKAVTVVFAVARTRRRHAVKNKRQEADSKRQKVVAMA